MECIQVTDICFSWTIFSYFKKRMLDGIDYLLFNAIIVSNVDVIYFILHLVIYFTVLQHWCLVRKAFSWSFMQGNSLILFSLVSNQFWMALVDSFRCFSLISSTILSSWITLSWFLIRSLNRPEFFHNAIKSVKPCISLTIIPLWETSLLCLIRLLLWVDSGRCFLHNQCSHPISIRIILIARTISKSVSIAHIWIVGTPSLLLNFKAVM